jgi:hypothetical protein
VRFECFVARDGSLILIPVRAHTERAVAEMDSEAAAPVTAAASDSCDVIALSAMVVVDPGGLAAIGEIARLARLAAGPVPGVGAPPLHAAPARASVSPGGRTGDVVRLSCTLALGGLTRLAPPRPSGPSAQEDQLSFHPAVATRAAPAMLTVTTWLGGPLGAWHWRCALPSVPVARFFARVIQVRFRC